MSSQGTGLNRNEDLLKLAYEQAQQSAEHHDTLLWEATYIVWGSTTLLLGFVLEAVEAQPFLCFVTALLSIFMTIMVYRLTRAFQDVRKQKYEMCQNIEKELGMPVKTHSDLVGQKGIQTKWYAATTVFLVVVWIVVAGVCLLYFTRSCPAVRCGHITAKPAHGPAWIPQFQHRKLTV